MSTKKAIFGSMGAILILLLTQTLAGAIASAFLIISLPVPLCNGIAGIVEEQVFRGFVMNLLRKRWNKWIAIFIQVQLNSIYNIKAPDIGAFYCMYLFLIPYYLRELKVAG